MMTWLLADKGTDGIDPAIWVYLAFVVLSAIGGLLGKKKQQQSEQQRRSQPQRRPGGRAATPRQTAPPAASRPPRPERGVKLAPPPQPPSKAQPTRWQPVQVYSRPLERPQMVRPILTKPTASEPTPVPAEPAAETAPAPGLMPRRVGEQKTHKVVRARELHRFRRLLSGKDGLRSAVVASEILAPPLALRENRHSW